MKGRKQEINYWACQDQSKKAIKYCEAAKLEKIKSLTRTKFEDINQSDFSNWKNSITIHAPENKESDIHHHLDTLDEKRTKVAAGSDISNDGYDLMHETAEVFCFEQQRKVRPECWVHERAW